MLSVVQAASLLLTAVALVPAGAHLLEMQPKLALDRDAYLAVQGLYAGWALFGIVYFGALLSNVLLAILVRRKRGPFILALLSVGALLAFFAVFFTWTFPANQATANWTMLPDNWETLRAEWEYSHAANAGLVFTAFLAVVLAVVTSRDREVLGP